MKKLWITLLVVLALAATMNSCKKNEGNGKAIEITGGQSKQIVYADVNQGSGGVTFKTLGAWTSTITDRATTRAVVSWISISPASGSSAGNYTINIMLDTNYTGADRTAVITIISNGESISITITQKGTTENGKKPMQEVAVTGVSLNKNATSLTVGGAETLVATIAPANATNQNVMWSSSAEGVATVDENGKVTAVSSGTATIIAATVDGGKTATCAVTVSMATVYVTGVSLNKTSTTLTVGGAETLTATVSPENAINQNVSWSSNNTDIATVDNGKVTGVGAGTATITVTTADGNKTATCAVTVSAATVSVTGVSLNKMTTTLTMGGIETLTATVTPANATNQNITWSSNATSVATVNNGKVTAVSAGEATITVTTVDGNKTATCTIIVNTATIAVTGVSINKNATSLMVGDTETLTATVVPTNATNQNKTWSSSNTAVATVDINGKVIAISSGTALITVKTTDGNKTSNCDITVYSASDDGVLVNGLIWATRNVGASGTFVSRPENYGNLYSITSALTACPTGWRIPTNSDFENLISSSSVWTTINGVNGRRFGSGNNSVFFPAAGYYYSGILSGQGSSGLYWSSTSVDRTQAYYFVINSSAYLNYGSHYSAQNSVRCIKDTEQITVPVANVSLNKTATIITVGDTEKLTATIAPSNATNKSVTWLSSNTGIASVDQTGKVTAVASGTATITVITADGNRTAICTVTVTVPTISVTGVLLNKSSTNLSMGDVKTLTATVVPANATNKSVTWSSSNTGIASVDQNGKITAIANGIATITVATADGNKTAYCIVTVASLYVEIPTIGLIVQGADITINRIDWTNANSLCNNSTIGGYTDWRLPTIEELTTIYAERNMIGGFQTGGLYWSSTSSGSSNYYHLIHFSTGMRYTDSYIKTYQGYDPAIGYYARCVRSLITNISINKSSTNLTTGDTETLTASVLPSNATNQNFTWSSNNTDIATVDQTGKVTAIIPGKATISVTAAGGKTATCTVNVSVPDSGSITIDGITWATRNVGSSGTFGGSPIDPGNLYTFDEAQNACPVGYRTPTRNELASLINQVNRGVNLNGQYGVLIGSGHNTLFFPSTGGTDGNTSYRWNFDGLYWSNTVEGNSNGYVLNFALSDSDTTWVMGKSIHSLQFDWRLGVRCVKE